MMMRVHSIKQNFDDKSLTIPTAILAPLISTIGGSSLRDDDVNLVNFWDVNSAW